MKVFVFLSAAALCFTSIANAQDQLQSGLYVGVVSSVADGSLSSKDDAIELKPGGSSLGGRIGYNKFTRSWLLGVEGDVAKSWITGSEKFNGGGFETAFDAEHTTLNTLRGRIGRKAGNAVIYGTGGLAAARVNAAVVVTSPTGSQVGKKAVDTASHLGIVLGGGVEVPISRRVSLTAEYLRVDFPSERMTFDIGIHSQPMVEDSHFDMHTLRVGFNFHF